MTDMLMVISVAALAIGEWAARRRANRTEYRVELEPTDLHNCYRQRLVRTPKGDE